MIRLWRSVLFVPGTRPDRFAKALASGADAVVFDLEDSVDASQKAVARREVLAFLATPADGGAQRLVRVNAAGSAWFAADLAGVRGVPSIDGVVLPKTDTAGAVEHVARETGAPAVIPLLETARGVLNAAAVAQAHASIPALLFGAEDLTADIGVPRTVDGDELIFPRSQVVLAAATIGASAIDAVFVDIANPDALRRDALRARAMGFRGKMAIHPSQVGVINEVFSPSPAEIDRARRLMAAYDEAAAKGEGVIVVDRQMVDVPIVARARRVIALADAITTRRPAGK